MCHCISGPHSLRWFFIDSKGFHHLIKVTLWFQGWERTVLQNTPSGFSYRGTLGKEESLAEERNNAPASVPLCPRVKAWAVTWCSPAGVDICDFTAHFTLESSQFVLQVSTSLSEELPNNLEVTARMTNQWPGQAKPGLKLQEEVISQEASLGMLCHLQL